MHAWAHVSDGEHEARQRPVVVVVAAAAPTLALPAHGGAPANSSSVELRPAVAAAADVPDGDGGVEVLAEAGDAAALDGPGVDPVRAWPSTLPPPPPAAAPTAATRRGTNTKDDADAASASPVRRRRMCSHRLGPWNHQSTSPASTADAAAPSPAATAAYSDSTSLSFSLLAVIIASSSASNSMAIRSVSRSWEMIDASMWSSRCGAWKDELS